MSAIPCQRGEQRPRLVDPDGSGLRRRRVSLYVPQVSWQKCPWQHCSGVGLGFAGTCRGRPLELVGMAAEVGGSKKGEKAPSPELIPTFLCHKQSKSASIDHLWIGKLT